MINTKIQKQAATFSVGALTQAVNSGILALNTATPSSGGVVHFTHTLMSSPTGGMLYTMGDGSFDPTRLTRVIVTDAQKAGVTVYSAMTSLRSYMQRWASTPDLLSTVIGAFTGNSNRGVRANSVRQQSPTQIRELVAKIAPTDHTLHIEIMADWIVSVLQAYSWITPGYITVHRVEAPNKFPTYNDMVDAVGSHDIRRMLESLGGTDRSVITAHIKNDDAVIAVGLIAQQMSYGVAEALTRVKGSHIPEHVVDALLLLCGQSWTPTTKDDTVLAPRSILESDAVSLFSSNLAIFLIYQERVAGGARLTLEFDYTVIKDDILPLVKEALTEISPFKLLPIADIVSHLSKVSVRDHRQVPSMVMIHENMSFPDSMQVFTRTQLDNRSQLRMLTVDNSISDQLSGALIPVTNQFSVSKMVRQKYHTAELLQPDTLIPKLGTDISVLFPSFLERLPQDSDILKDWAAFAKAFSPLSTKFRNVSEEQNTENISLYGEEWKAYAGVISDHYKMITHLAVHKCSGVRVNTYDLDLAEFSLALTYSLTTDLKTPIGRSPIVGGFVTTTEPLEFLLYGDDIAATTTLTSAPIDIESYEGNGLHAWDWKAESKALDYATEYKTELRGTDYTVKLDMRHLLGLTMPRLNLRYFRNRLAAVTVKLWFNELFEQISDLEKMIKKSKDELKTATYHAQLSAFNMLIAKQLIAIGKTTIGTKGITYIKHDIQHQMFDSGSLDDYTHIHVGVQATLLNLWMGLTTLDCLCLLSPEEINKVTDHIRTSGILAHVVAEADDLVVGS